MTSELIKQITDDSFTNDVIKSDKPILIDFWAEWCGPCRMMSAILEEVASDYEGKLVVGKINTDENRQTPTQFGIRGIPTMMLFKNGELVATKVGATTKSQLISFIEPHLDTN